MHTIQNKTVIIVGASGGIGSVIARTLSQEGANVVLVARTREKLDALGATLSGEHLVLPADASDADGIGQAFAEAAKRFGTVDAVVIAAGTWKQLDINASVAEAVSLSDAHYKALFLPSFITGFIAQQFFRKEGHGTIFNISSHAAIRPELSANLTYGPMKAAARHFMRSLEHELHGTNIRVCDIQPAIVNTPDAAGMLDTEDKKARAVQPETIAQWIVEHFENPPSEKLFDSTLVL